MLPLHLEGAKASARRPERYRCPGPGLREGAAPGNKLARPHPPSGITEEELSTLAAALMLTPGTPLGLPTNAVQALASVMLLSATVFLLLLCNDEAVLGPWINGRPLHVFTGAVIAVLVMLSITLTRSVLFPEMGGLDATDKSVPCRP